MTESTAKSTHAQRRKSQQVKSQWTDRIVAGSHALDDLVEASQGNSKDAQYISSMLLVDLLAAVHPGLPRGRIITELEPLPIKLPADPARFSIRSIRSRPDLVNHVSGMLKPSAMTKSSRARTDVPTEWPWGTKLSTLIRINGGEMPQGLEFLETGDESHLDPGDLLLAGPDAVGTKFSRQLANADNDKIVDAELEDPLADTEIQGTSSNGVDKADIVDTPDVGEVESVVPIPAQDADTLATLEAEFGFGQPESPATVDESPAPPVDPVVAEPAEDESATPDDAISTAFADIFQQEAK